MQTIFNNVLQRVQTLKNIKDKYYEPVLLVVLIGKYFVSINEDAKIISQILNIPLIKYRSNSFIYFDNGIHDTHINTLTNTQQNKTGDLYTVVSYCPLK